MYKEKNSIKSEPGIGKTIIDDLRRGDFSKNLSREWKELREFFITEERKKRLEAMNRFQKFIYMTGWLLKSLYMKLPPTRRILILVAFLLVIAGHQVANSNPIANQNELTTAAGLILLFILMLELKDKLLARNELEAGRSVQNALMPEEAPEFNGWSLWLFTRPANDVGGDLVDFIRLTDTKCGLAIADISGKGLGAALVMAKLQATLRAFTDVYPSLSELASKINNIYYRDTLPHSFASLIYLIAESESGNVRLFNAGHMLPLVVNGNSITELPKTSPAFGIMHNASYQEQEISVDKGGLIFLYSDGLTESVNQYDEFFGLDRLKMILPRLLHLSAPEIGKRMLDEVEYFAADSPSHDDLSMIIMKRL